jgi:hypothetical protein
MHLAERELQGQALSSFGARTCLSGRGLSNEPQPERRDLADTGKPVERW